jgi:hypothetical protein
MQGTQEDCWTPKKFQPSKTFVQIAPKAKLAGIQPIDVSWWLERNEVHVNGLLCNVKETKH